MLGLRPHRKLHYYRFYWRIHDSFGRLLKINKKTISELKSIR